MQKIDINKYGSNRSGFSNNSFKKGSFAVGSHFFKFFLIVFWRFFLSLVAVGTISGAVLLVSFQMLTAKLSENDIEIDIKASKMNLTSFVYVTDENGAPQEYQRIYGGENRVWVDFKNIPDHMKNAIIAIEDKRFYKHKGVDYRRTTGAIVSMLSGTQVYGGSTLTQQLVKNITGENQNSPKRKVQEMIRANKIEKHYSKDEILESYANEVNFGGGAHGVQAAANLYFSKSISECSLAECCAIAAITKNPTAYNPFNYPGNNRARREVVLSEMLAQEKISQSEYNEAMDESSKMEFIEKVNSSAGERSNLFIKNWYMEVMIRDMVEDLCVKYNISKKSAEEMVYTQGLRIYSAMDKKMQDFAEAALKDKNLMPKDENIELGFLMMDFKGRVLASLGSRKEKTADLLYDRATVARRQPGSTMKPLAAYAPAINLGIYHYSSKIPDQPLKIRDKDWPSNWYGGYRGEVLLKWAVEKSANAPPAQVINMLGTLKVYDFLTKKLFIKGLDNEDSYSLSALAAGGTHYGVTVRDMVAAYQIFGNAGKYNKPFTYYYVEDKNGKVILDNRDNIPEQAISSETATVLNRLLRNVAIGAEGTGRSANIPGVSVFMKTGTTTDDKDSWLLGGTPYAVAGVWIGYDEPKRIRETAKAGQIWKHMMMKYLSGKSPAEFELDGNVIEAKYCAETGLLANVGCPGMGVGYYIPSNLPHNCHLHGGVPADQAEKIAEGSDGIITSTEQEPESREAGMETQT